MNRSEGDALSGRRAAAAHRSRQTHSRVRKVGGRRIIAEGLESNLWKDIYYNAMTASWAVFVGALAAAFLALNVVFALVYDLGDHPIANADNGFASLFFFSVETASTVGYGDMHPQTLYARLVATTESFVGVMMLATMTGLVFARISRPRARILFARNPVIATHNGVPTLMFRLANARSNFITEATAKAWTIGPSVSQEGRRMIGFEPLRLIRSENPTLALSWVLFHPIDDDSPIQGMDEEALVASETNFVVSIAGFDETSGQTVHSRSVFAAEDVRFGHEYEDIIWSDDNGVRHIDYARISAVRPATRIVKSVASSR
jgi:inward rectifier potassium channel